VKSEISIICFDQILLVISVYDRQTFSPRRSVVNVLFMEGPPVCVSLLTLQVKVYIVGWYVVFVTYLLKWLPILLLFSLPLSFSLPAVFFRVNILYFVWCASDYQC